MTEPGEEAAESTPVRGKCLVVFFDVQDLEAVVGRAGDSASGHDPVDDRTGWGDVVSHAWCLLPGLMSRAVTAGRGSPRPQTRTLLIRPCGPHHRSARLTDTRGRGRAPERDPSPEREARHRCGRSTSSDADLGLEPSGLTGCKSPGDGAGVRVGAGPPLFCLSLCLGSTEGTQKEPTLF